MMSRNPPAPAIDCVLRLDQLQGLPKEIAMKAPDSALAALATAIGVDAVRACQADLRVTPVRADEVRVIGAVRARVVQTCVATLESFETDILEPIDVRYAGSEAIAAAEAQIEAAQAADSDASSVDVPEPLADGRIDLGALVQEFLALGVDPYPRKPGAVFEGEPAEEGRSSPFASLATLRGKPTAKG